jgi:hypothetical protein
MKNETKFHLLFLFILSLFYLLPFLIFGEFIIQHPDDRLNVEIVNNHLIGQIFKGNFEAANLMFNGEYKYYYFIRIFHPLMIIYALFELNYSYWIYDIIVNFISYITFFIFAKKISNDLLICSFSSALFVSLNQLYAPVMLTTIFGLGVAAIPYLLYLNLKEKPLKIKHYLILLFFGLNTHFYELLVLPVIFLIIFALNKKVRLNLFFKISAVFFISIFISNINLFLILLSDLEFQRKMLIGPLELKDNLILALRRIFFLYHLALNPFKIWMQPLVEQLPYLLLNFSVFFYLIYSKNKLALKLFGIIIFLAIICFIERTYFFNNLIRNYDALNLINTINLHRVYKYIAILYVIIFFTINSQKRNFFLCTIGLISLIFFQIRPLIYPSFYTALDWKNVSIVKKKSIKNSFYNQDYIKFIKDIYDESNINNFKNKSITSKYVLSINNYYNFNEFKKIKKIVKNKRVLVLVDLKNNSSITKWIGPFYNDPMILVANNIFIMGGLAQFISENYHTKFREIISSELNKNEYFRNSYDEKGYRIYAYVNNHEDIDIDFVKAKSLGASYVFSRKKVNHNKLDVICENCFDNKFMNLYLLN